MPTRRAVLAGLAAVTLTPIPALATPAARAFRFYFPRVRFSLDPLPYLEMRAVLCDADWRYQSLAEQSGDARGVIQHLPSGFAYYTAPDPRYAEGAAECFHEARCLMSAGESFTQDYALRRAIGRAAAWTSTLIEDSDSGAFYIPRGYTSPQGPREQSAPPFIAAAIRGGFMLHA